MRGVIMAVSRKPISSPTRLVYHLYLKNGKSYLRTSVSGKKVRVKVLGPGLTPILLVLVDALRQSAAAKEPLAARGWLSRRQIARAADGVCPISDDTVTQYLGRIEDALQDAVDLVKPGLVLPLFQRGDSRGARIAPGVRIIVHEDRLPPERPSSTKPR
jgi:hypothetical protein